MSSLLSGTVSYCKYSTGKSKGQPLIDANKTPEDSNGKNVIAKAPGICVSGVTTRLTGKQNLNVKKQTELHILECYNSS